MPDAGTGMTFGLLQGCYSATGFEGIFIRNLISQLNNSATD